MDVITLLEHDHQTVDELFRRFQIADRADTKDEIAKEVVRELSIHAAVEEQFVYPLVRAKLDDETAEHSIEEHAEVKELLTTVEKHDAGSSEHDEAMAEIIDAVRHHVKEEEDDMFDRLRAATNPDTLDRVGSLVESAKKVVPTHPHPLIPGTATAQLVAGPWAAMVDKVRDALGD